MAEVQKEWVQALAQRLDKSDEKIDELGVHFDNNLQKVNDQLHAIELALSKNWHETTKEISTCRHTQNNKLQVISSTATLCKEGRVGDLTKVKEDFNKKLVEVEKSTDNKLDIFKETLLNLTLLTNELKVKIAIYAGIGTLIVGTILKFVKF